MSVRICGDIVTPDAIVCGGAIVVGDDGRIEAVERSGSAPDFDYVGSLIVPGFIDIHVHGGGGADFMDATVESVRQSARVHGRFGTTTLLATTLTASREQISSCIAAVCAVIDDPHPDEAQIAGIHLEGPYICAAKRGAQPLEPIRAPDWEEMKSWIDQSSGRVKLITMAPEIDGALEFIEKAVATGVIVSIGHTNASYDQAMAAIDAGAKHGTHLFNAMPPLSHRAPGAAGALLTREGAFVEMIADGVHLHPAVVRLAVGAKGVGGVILITDAISGAAMPDGDFKLGGQTARVRNGTVKFDDGTLAGSVLTMNRAFTNVQRFAQVSAVAAAKMTSANAARSLGIYPGIGGLEVGMRADLAVIHPESSMVAATMRGGKWIARA